MLKKFLARDVSSFSRMIEQNFIYVDKTEHIYALYAEGNRHHLLTRPRRFGKSLLISTLEELFSGNKELFKDLWIETSDFAFIRHPVIRLDFSGMSHSSPKALTRALTQHLIRIGKHYGINLDEEDEIKELASDLIPRLAGINKVVLLIGQRPRPKGRRLERTLTSLSQGSNAIGLHFEEALKFIPWDATPVPGSIMQELNRLRV